MAPGADPSRIRLAWKGATDVTADGGGALQVATGAGTVTDTAPVSYQNNPGGHRDQVASAFHLDKTDRRVSYGFDLGAYDRSRRSHVSQRFSGT